MQDAGVWLQFHFQLNGYNADCYTTISNDLVLQVKDKEDMETWTTFWTKIWRDSMANLPQRKDTVEYIKETTKGLCEPFQTLIESTPPDSECFIDEMKYWVPVPFDNHAGRVTLAGDAAHPMLICMCYLEISCFRIELTLLLIKSVARGFSTRLQMQAIMWTRSSRHEIRRDKPE